MSEKYLEVKKPTISEDYKSGITNFRVLAKRHDKTLKEIANYLKNY
tara:strand:+ start:296 stop:433 length:138 start_codon:yes stop_codon:yes gene_type:complete